MKIINNFHVCAVRASLIVKVETKSPQPHAEAQVNWPWVPTTAETEVIKKLSALGFQE